MKSILQKITLALTLVSLLYAGCKNPAKDVQIIVSTDIFKSPVFLQFVNAKYGAEGPKSFTVKIIGPGAGLVRTTTGSKVFKVTDGYLNLLLDRSATPSPSNPVKFTVIASVPGFAPTYQDVVVTSEKDPIAYKVFMNEYANPAAATAAAVSTQAITNGSTGGDVKFTTTTNAGMTEKTEITIPAGTGFLDATGQPTGGAQLEVRMVHTGIDANGGMTVIPANGYAANATDNNGNPISGGVYFNPVASVSINMLAGTKEVKGFTKPVTVDVELNAAKINPATNQAIKEGETIPMWSLNTESGQWKQEGNANVVKNTNGKLVGRMQITHLTDWGLFYNYTPCTSTVIVNRNTEVGYDTFMISSGGLTAVSSVSFNPGEKSKTTTVYASSGQGKITVSTFGSFGFGVLDSKYANSAQSITVTTNLCGQTYTFNFAPKSDLVNVDVSVMFKCTTKDVLTGINSFITVTPINGGETQTYYLRDGKGSGQFINGTTYKVTAQVDDKIYTGQFTAKKENFTLPTGYDLTGAASYNGLTNRLTIEGIVKKDCN